jgi:spore coat protein U-like protein
MKHAWHLKVGPAAVLLLALATAGQVHAGCTVSSSGLAFGAYQPLTFAGKLTSAAVNSVATVSVVCTGIVTGGNYTLALGPSLVGAGNRISTRYLSNTSGGDNMAFNVYRELTYASVWGDSVTAGSVLGGSIPAGDSSQSQSVYGKIPAGQNTLKAGTFSGSLTMTLTYNP